MMRVTFLPVVFLIIFLNLNAQEDLTKKPEPMPEVEFKFPPHKQFTFDNGLKIFVIEDHEQPTVALRLLVAGGKSMDTIKPGVSEITASLLTKGTSKLTALELAKKIDGVGLELSADAGVDFITVSASGLTKHLDLLLDVFSQVILEPSFAESEFKKMIPQMLAGIEQDKGDPGTIASKMSRKVIYGERHPYALDPTVESVKSIKVEDIKKYYRTYFVPDNSSLAIIGDVDSAKVVSAIKKIFRNWKKSEKPEKIVIPAAKPMPLGVYFIERPGSVQSTISFSTKGLPYNDKDYDKLNLSANVISGGLSGRLFRTIREEHSYSYTPFGNLSQSKYAGRYFCGADVKNIVTDSALDVMLEQIRLLTTETPSQEELNRVKMFMTGGFKMSFENSEFLASAIQNADFYDKPLRELENYTKDIMFYTPYDIMDLASRFINPKKGYIIVVGSAEVKDKLAKYGKLYDYDLDLIPLSGEKAKLEKTSYDAVDLIEKYIQALGGAEALGQIQTIIDTATSEMISSTSSLKGKLIQYQKSPNKKHFIYDLGIFRQEGWIDGTNVWVKLEKPEKIENNDAEKYLYDALMFKDTKLLESGYNCKVLGKQNGQILMRATSPKGFESTYYFDAMTFLLTKTERTEETGQGVLPITETIKEYIEINGVKFPKIIEQVNPMYTIRTENSYTINQPMDDGIFKPGQ